MEFWSLEDKAGSCSLWGLRVQRSPDHLGPCTEDSGAGAELCTDPHKATPGGRPGQFGRPAEQSVTVLRGEAGNKVFGSAAIPSKGITVHRDGGGSPESFPPK